VLSVNVSLPRDVTWNGKTARTAIWKSPVEGQRMVRKLDIDGDAHADLAGHGGSTAPYSSTRWILSIIGSAFGVRNDFTFGHFEENLTVEGLPDDEVCNGNRYRMCPETFSPTSSLSPHDHATTGHSVSSTPLIRSSFIRPPCTSIQTERAHLEGVP
jgi:hypothetical protein